jgi:hypothetical protein
MIKKHTRNQNRLQFAIYVLVVLATLAAGLALAGQAYGIVSWPFALILAGAAFVVRLAWIGARFAVQWD